jgi:hypothetical protein
MADHCLCPDFELRGRAYEGDCAFDATGTKSGIFRDLRPSPEK